RAGRLDAADPVHQPGGGQRDAQRLLRLRLRAAGVPGGEARRAGGADAAAVPAEAGAGPAAAALAGVKSTDPFGSVSRVSDVSCEKHLVERRRTADGAAGVTNTSKDRYAVPVCCNSWGGAAAGSAGGW